MKEFRVNYDYDNGQEVVNDTIIAEAETAEEAEWVAAQCLFDEITIGHGEGSCLVVNKDIDHESNTITVELLDGEETYSNFRAIEE